MPAGAAGLALTLASGAAATLLRQLGQRHLRSSPCHFTWHDTTEGELAAAGLALLAWRRGRQHGWRLTHIRPPPALPCGGEGEIVAEATALADLGVSLPSRLAPICNFDGRARSAVLGALRLDLLEGELHATAVEPLGRAIFSGPPDALAALAQPVGSLATESLAAAALRVAGRPLPPPRAAQPELQAGTGLSDAIALICAHFGDLIGLGAPAAAAGLGPEPVHQMRVAVRRMRSALRLFRRAAPCREIADIDAALRTLGRILGPARDWDVFLGGSGAAVAAAFGEDAAVRRMLAAAQRQRALAYADLRAHLAGGGFRRLRLALAAAAIARPWKSAPGASLEAALPDFAAAALGRQWRRLMAPGPDLTGLAADRLHEVRIEAKRLRYAAELFAPLFRRHAAARFIARTTDLQDRLGHLNDAATAAALMTALGPAGSGFAGGVVRGLVAGQSGDLRGQAQEAWRRLRKEGPFWI